MIGEKIKKERKAQRLTQERLAELAGIAREQVNRYENDKAVPDTETIFKIADALGKPYSYFVEEKNEATDDLDADTWEIRERLRRDPNFRILFDAASDASPDHILAAAAMLNSLKPKEFSE